AGLLASTGSTGDSYDNAMAESINGLYKAEVIHRKSWKNRAEVVTNGAIVIHTQRLKSDPGGNLLS
ncbi:IS3 family transposase, partial [Escherichia coli]|nr:IS3 family transposase [Escherichia coli]